MQSQNPYDFVFRWIGDHVHATGYQPHGDNAEALRLAERCREDAAAAGYDLDTPIFRRAALATEMAAAIEKANDRNAGK